MSAMRAAISAELDKAVRNMQALAADAAMQAQLEQAVGLCTDALRDGRKLLFAGNGGSAADAQHWAGELVSRFYYDRPGLAAIALLAAAEFGVALAVCFLTVLQFSRGAEAAAE